MLLNQDQDLLADLSIAICIPHICHFFSTYPIFGSIFLHAKARKSHQNGFRQNSVIRHKTDFTTTKQRKFLISSHLSCGYM